jgi:hypothetical protein
VDFVVCTLAVKKKIRAGFDLLDRTIPLLVLLATYFHPGFFLGLLFDHEDGGNIFLQNISSLSVHYMTLYPRR